MLQKSFLFLGFSFCPFLCPFLFVSKNILNFPYCSISLISAVCFSVFSRPKKISFDFSLNFQYLQRYTKKEQASGLVSFWYNNILRLPNTQSWNAAQPSGRFLVFFLWRDSDKVSPKWFMFFSLLVIFCLLLFIFSFSPPSYNLSMCWPKLQVFSSNIDWKYSSALKKLTSTPPEKLSVFFSPLLLFLFRRLQLTDRLTDGLKNKLTDKNIVFVNLK